MTSEVLGSSSSIIEDINLVVEFCDSYVIGEVVIGCVENGAAILEFA
jgi:hypothetical protein